MLPKDLYAYACSITGLFFIACSVLLLLYMGNEWEKKSALIGSISHDA